MKNFCFLLFIFFCLSGEIQATIHQVNNVNPAIGHFSGLQAAIDAASEGDTIYIHGSHVDYGAVTLNKRLILIGPGWAPRMQNSQTANINQINLNTTTDPVSGLTLAPDSSVIIGIRLVGILNGGSYNADYMHFERVYFTTSTSAVVINNFGGNNHTFIGCWFRGRINPAGDGRDNWHFLNCIFDPNAPFIANFPLTNPSFIQCIFTRNTSNPIIEMFGSFQGGSSNATFINNIFMLVNPVPNCNGCTFLNNMTFGAGAPDLNDFGIVSEDNFIGTSLGFVNFNAGIPYSPNRDLSFEAGSPAIGAGVNGEDLGVMGGQPGNFVQFGQPDIPKLDILQILNPYVKQGDELILRIRATMPQ